MTVSANTLGQTASTLIQQLESNTINFQQYRDSMNTVIASSNDNEEFQNENNAEAVRQVSVATRIAQGEEPPVRRNR